MRNIAPGKWHPLDRRIARVLSQLVGVFMLWIAYRFGMPLINSERELGLWAALLVLVPFALGAASLFPNVLMPLFVRVIDKALKDKP